MFIYPNDLKAKAKLWLWELRDLAILGVGLILSVLALSQGLGMLPLVVTVLYGILSITFPVKRWCTLILRRRSWWGFPMLLCLA